MEQNEKNALQKLKKEMQEMRDAYEARLQAKEQEKKQATDARKAQLKHEEEWLNEYVEIRLFKDNEKYKDDVYVAINGKNCVIKRGVWTRIRRKFALLLDQSEIQDLRTAELIAGEALRFEAASRQRGL